MYIKQLILHYLLYNELINSIPYMSKKGHKHLMVCIHFPFVSVFLSLKHVIIIII